ncbi:divalent-cation tolerance protein CutA [Streptomyces luteolus]|uniref:Divalent-cation tolerance protein CutA n=1 Tax=Streptomyces luteolus TaxID=3043615 RepID=A0ABT6SZU8_9ACTN|nr:divalent-cation tolerance protein CutA [Streptomyces sp. B-S-A12]MDI3421132.1 divalent-cation tolerance protein CutA [Streptomyces sp. B-S-A12]
MEQLPDIPVDIVLTVLTTTDSADKARSLAEGAVAARHAACAQVSGPVTSVYRWEGAVTTDQEWQVLLKTTADSYPALERWITDTHDYDTPEIIATPVVRGSADYLRWVRAETAK